MTDDRNAPRLALIETSHRSGWVALGRGEDVLTVRALSEARRHARDLAPMLAELLAEQNWQARDLSAVVVSRGPGSYTGLRVGLMSAKTLAYATGCALLAVDTFAVIASQAPPGSATLDVIADAQQDRIYLQRFVEQVAEQLRIVPLANWLETLESGVLVSGPGLEIHVARLPRQRLVAADRWLPRPESLLRLGLDRFLRGEKDDPFAVEPLYLRASSAEEKWVELGKG